MATAQHARHQAVCSAVWDLTGNNSAPLPLSPVHQWNSASTTEHHCKWRQKQTDLHFARWDHRTDSQEWTLGYHSAQEGLGQARSIRAGSWAWQADTLELTPEELKVTINTFQRPEVLQLVLISLHNYILHSCLLARGGRKMCHAGQKEVVAWASPCTAPNSLGTGGLTTGSSPGHLAWPSSSGHQLSCFIVTCPASQPRDLARQHPGHGASLPSPLISPQL